MSINKKLQEAEALFKKIEARYKTLGRENPFEFDINNIKDVNKEIERLETILDGVDATVESF